MASDSCCGRLVALFEPSQCAPGEASLAGCAVGYRGRVSAKCHCDVSGGLSEVELMREDMLASGADAAPPPTAAPAGADDHRTGPSDIERQCFA